MVMIMAIQFLVGWYVPRLVLSLKSNWLMVVPAVLVAWISVVGVSLGISWVETSFGGVPAGEAMRRSFSNVILAMLLSIVSSILRIRKAKTLH